MLKNHKKNWIKTKISTLFRHKKTISQKKTSFQLRFMIIFMQKQATLRRKQLIMNSSINRQMIS